MNRKNRHCRNCGPGCQLRCRAGVGGARRAEVAPRLSPHVARSTVKKLLARVPLPRNCAIVAADGAGITVTGRPAAECRRSVLRIYSKEGELWLLPRKQRN